MHCIRHTAEHQTELSVPPHRGTACMDREAQTQLQAMGLDEWSHRLMSIYLRPASTTPDRPLEYLIPQNPQKTHRACGFPGQRSLLHAQPSLSSAHILDMLDI